MRDPVSIMDNGLRGSNNRENEAGDMKIHGNNDDRNLSGVAKEVPRRPLALPGSRRGGARAASLQRDVKIGRPARVIRYARATRLCRSFLLILLA